MSERYEYIGTGWSFPPTFNKPTRKVETTSDADDINSSLHILLSTRPGERVMQPKYGCNLEIMLFEPITVSLKTYVIDLIKNAILQFEPRIEVENINISPDGEEEGLLLIKIDYKISNTNSRQNFVYPFYKNEGTNI